MCQECITSELFALQNQKGQALSADTIKDREVHTSVPDFLPSTPGIMNTERY